MSLTGVPWVLLPEVRIKSVVVLVDDQDGLSTNHRIINLPSGAEPSYPCFQIVMGTGSLDRRIDKIKIFIVLVPLWPLATRTGEER